MQSRPARRVYRAGLADVVADYMQNFDFTLEFAPCLAHRYLEHVFAGDP
jgi:hypothetical protein